MWKKPALLILPSLLGIGLWLNLGGCPSAGAPPQLAKVVHITMSKACGCMLDRCKAGDRVVDKVFVGDKKSLVQRLDYSTDKDIAREYIKKYRITMPPALLFLDAQGNLLWSAMGELDHDAVLTKLNQFGS